MGGPQGQPRMVNPQQYFPGPTQGRPVRIPRHQQQNPMYSSPPTGSPQMIPMLHHNAPSFIPSQTFMSPQVCCVNRSTLCKKACPHFLSYTNMNKIGCLPHVKEDPQISNFLQLESHSSKSFKVKAISDLRDLYENKIQGLTSLDSNFCNLHD